MERVCRRCGRVYRGLVCQTCHPRGSRRGKPAEAQADRSAEDAAGEIRITNELTQHADLPG